MSRLHENDENDVSFSMKTQTFENDLQSGKIWKRNSIGFVWTGRISTCIQKTKMENIERERIVVFIGISLLLSLIVNWQLNVYAYKFK